MSAFDFKLDSMSDIEKSQEQERQQRLDDFRKNAAMNAMTNLYGPIAADPEDALKNQQYQQNNALNPLLVQKQQLENTGADLGNQEKSAQLPYAGPQAEANVNEANARAGLYNSQTAAQNAGLPYVGAEKQAAIANTQATTADTLAQTQVRAFQLKQGQAAADRATAAGILSGLASTAATGGDMGAAFDANAPTIAALTGGDPQRLAGLRANLVRDPQGTINNMQAALLASGMLTGAPGAKGMMTPQQRLQAVNAMKVQAARSAAVPNTLQQMVTLLPQMSGSAIIRKAKEHVPGTAEYQFDQLANSVSSNLSLDDLRSLRATGFTLGAR